MMNPEIKAKWVADLRSGEYRQGKKSLHIKDYDDRDYYCCLGVLCEQAVKAGVIESNKLDFSEVGYGPYRETKLLPKEVLDWAGLPVDHFNADERRRSDVRLSSLTTLTSLNDGTNQSFNDIANHIEEDDKL